MTLVWIQTFYKTFCTTISDFDKKNPANSSNVIRIGQCIIFISHRIIPRLFPFYLSFYCIYFFCGYEWLIRLCERAATIIVIYHLVYGYILRYNKITQSGNSRYIVSEDGEFFTFSVICRCQPSPNYTIFYVALHSHNIFWCENCKENNPKYT